MYLEGRLQTRKWSNREGDKRTTVEVVANLMRILDRAPKNGNGPKSDETSQAAQPVDENDNPFDEARAESVKPDLPF